MDSTYADTLKQLIGLADIKLFIVANTLGYDISYISKWCNGAKLPSVKMISSIHQQLSRLLAKSILEQNLSLAFYSMFDLTSPVHRSSTSLNSLEADIIKILNAAYKTSAPHVVFQEKNDYLKYAVGHHVIFSELRQSIQQAISEIHDTTIHIWTSLDLFSNNATFLLQILQSNVSMNRRLLLHIGFNLSKQLINLDSIHKIVELLSQHPEINIELYDNSSFNCLNFILINDYFFANFTTDENDNIQMMSYGTRQSILSQLSKYVLPFFSSTHLILELKDSYNIASTNFRTSFYAATDFIFLCNYGFEYLLPSSIVKEIADYSFEQTGSRTDATEIQKLQITWEEVFEKANLKFIIPKSALFEYFEKSEILYCSTHYKLSQKQQQMHINYIIQCMRTNPNIHLYIFDDFNVRAGRYKKIFNMYFNQFQFYIKNVLYPSESYSSMLTILKHPSFLKAFSDFLQDIIDSPHCQEYNVEQMAKISRKYGRMFTRLQKINERL